MIWMIGAGQMAQDYAKVLRGLDKKFITIGRGKESAEAFEKQVNCPVKTGGLDQFARESPKPADYAIVATPVDCLYANTLQLLEMGVKTILLEKPGATKLSQFEDLSKAAKHHKAQIYLAYNRRFYSSVMAAKKLIAQEGGPISFNFEFTEWSHRIEKLGKSREIFENWLLANSSHVIDMAFYLGGSPQTISCFADGEGELKWHPANARFSGAGITKDNAVFSYIADWTSSGRWALEVNTAENRYIFRPLEKLQVNPKGTVAINEVEIDDKFDLEFKPGLYAQTRAFISKDFGEFVDIHSQQEMAAICESILQGKTHTSD